MFLKPVCDIILNLPFFSDFGEEGAQQCVPREPSRRLQTGVRRSTMSRRRARC
jgi:hypothetical protein